MDRGKRLQLGRPLARSELRGSPQLSGAGAKVLGSSTPSKVLPNLLRNLERASCTRSGSSNPYELLRVLKNSKLCGKQTVDPQLGMLWLAFWGLSLREKGRDWQIWLLQLKALGLIARSLERPGKALVPVPSEGKTPELLFGCKYCIIMVLSGQFLHVSWIPLISGGFIQSFVLGSSSFGSNID